MVLLVLRPLNNSFFNGRRQQRIFRILRTNFSKISKTFHDFDYANLSGHLLTVDKQGAKNPIFSHNTVTSYQQKLLKHHTDGSYD